MHPTSPSLSAASWNSDVTPGAQGARAGQKRETVYVDNDKATRKNLGPHRCGAIEAIPREVKFYLILASVIWVFAIAVASVA